METTSGQETPKAIYSFDKLPDFYETVSGTQATISADEVERIYPSRARLTWDNSYYVRRIANEKMKNTIAQAISDPAPDVDIKDYFEIFRMGLANWHEIFGKATLLGDAVDQGIEKLIESNPQNIHKFTEVGLAYDEHLKSSKYYYGNYDSETFTSWRVFVSSQAAIPSDHKHEAYQYRTGKADTIPEALVDPIGPKTPWRLIWLNTKTSSEYNGQFYRAHIFGPNIADKDTGMLLEALDHFEEEGIKEAFNFRSERQSGFIHRWAGDGFAKILEEAGAAGWGNAQMLSSALDKMPKRDIAQHSMIIHLANLITESLNRSFSGEVELQKLRPTDIENTTEAINRCLYAVFELGEQPKGKDPLNYLIMGEIVSTVFNKVKEAEKELLPVDEPRPDPRSEQVRDLRQASRSDRTFWARWKAGYGIFS